ncbi:breast carcinoma-amplified sequence 1 isoform X2 [Salminus brasiliensis]|uniref:breast carcinoma-amplified sequence 1 isoform X2 n=1 Tax=Salminus brasiliensis TaxID=930266 RepID=UPI003B835813
MGNRQSVDITIPQTEHGGKNVQNGAPNGHAISGSDLPDAVSVEVSVQQNSEPPAVTQANSTNPAPEPVQASVEVVAVEVSPEQAIPADINISTNEDAPKPAQTANFFKMFKKKYEPVAPEPEVSIEVSVQQNSEPPAETQANSANPAPESVPVNAKEASAAVVSVEVSPEQAVPAETKTLPNEEAPRPAQTSSFFKMFKKKNEPVAPEPEVSVEVSVQQNSEPPAETQASTADPAPESVQASVAVVAVEVSPEQAIPADINISTNEDAPKPAQTASFFKMFKKKNEPVAPEPEVSFEASVQQNSESPAVQVTQASNADPAAVVSVEVSPEQAIPAEISIPANKEATKPALKASFFKKLKKKNEPVAPEPEVSIEVSVQQNSQPPAMTQASNADPAPESVQASVDVVSVEVSPEQAIPADINISTNEDAPKPAQTASFFKMFKKKNEPVAPEPEESFEASVQQNSESPAVQVTQASNGDPAPESVQAGLAVVSVEVSPEQAIPAEINTAANKKATKPALKASFFKKLKKKNEPVAPEPEVSIEVSLQQNSETHAVTQANNANPAPESVQANAKEASSKVLSVEVSPEQAIPTEINISTNEEAPKPAQTASFFKMFKKKNEPVVPEPEVSVEVSVQQNSESPAVTQANSANPAPESVQASVEVMSVEVSPEQAIPADINISTNEDAPKPAQTTNFFKMFKKKNEPVAPESAVTFEVSLQQNSEPPVMTQTRNANPATESVQVNAKEPSAAVVSLEVLPEQANVPANEEAPKPAQTASFFKMFKKKNEPVVSESEGNASAEGQIIPEVQTDGQKSEPPDIKGSTQAEKEPQGESLSPSVAEVAEDSAQPEETDPEENPVMNFFKTLVGPTKATKEAAAASDASKDQSQKEIPSPPTANVQEALKVPPPPPPAPPKMESKAEPAIKKEEAPPAEAAAAAAAKETPSKAKAKDSPFGKLFRPKALLGKVVSKVQAVTASGASAPAKTSTASVVKEEAQPVVVQVDASKTSTLEAAAKPEPPPAPKPEEKKSEKKHSPFANLLKPKVLLGQVTSKIQAAASSAAASVSLGTGGAAKEPKKEAPAATPTVAEATASAKAKEEPKPAVAAAAAAAPDNKSVGSADNPSPSIPRKLEKRNSIQLFFKNLSQKRHSDAGVQTEAVAPEKAK